MRDGGVLSEPSHVCVHVLCIYTLIVTVSKKACHINSGTDTVVHGTGRPCVHHTDAHTCTLYCIYNVQVY